MRDLCVRNLRFWGLRSNINSLQVYGVALAIVVDRNDRNKRSSPGNS